MKSEVNLLRLMSKVSVDGEEIPQLFSNELNDRMKELFSYTLGVECTENGKLETWDNYFIEFAKQNSRPNSEMWKLWHLIDDFKTLYYKERTKLTQDHITKKSILISYNIRLSKFGIIVGLFGSCISIVSLLFGVILN